MASQIVPQPAPSGQNPLSIQQNIASLRRRLTDNDAAFLCLLAERQELEAEYAAETVRYQDAINAGWLAIQGAAAVEAVEAMFAGK